LATMCRLAKGAPDVTWFLQLANADDLAAQCAACAAAALDQVDHCLVHPELIPERTDAWRATDPFSPQRCQPCDKCSHGTVAISATSNGCRSKAEALSKAPSE